MKHIKNIFILMAALVMLATGSCSKLLDTEPSNAVGEKVVYENIEMINALLMSTYSMLKNEEPGWMNQHAVNVILWSTAYGSDINADPNPTYGNATPYKAAAHYLAESWNPNEYAPRGLWKVHYKVIFNANVILENIENVSGDQSRKDEIKGQALTMRARCYFNLVRMYQHTYIIANDKPGVPLRLTSSIEENFPRSTVEEVYVQIEKDLKDAETLLESYSRPGLGFYNVDVVRFLLANVYLTMNNWTEARTYANKVRTVYPLMSIEQYADGFTTPNSEWILGYGQTEQDNSSYNLAAFYDYG
ncbi:MAG: RagB/SusD family nutrient uptake outer membrane protein, partial [Bacteroidales bacterium]